jgi:hypothetical protein
MIKRFEPSREREVLIALDVQTAEGPVWDALSGSDDVEALYVVARRGPSAGRRRWRSG